MMESMNWKLGKCRCWGISWWFHPKVIRRLISRCWQTYIEEKWRIGKQEAIKKTEVGRKGKTKGRKVMWTDGALFKDRQIINGVPVTNGASYLREKMSRNKSFIRSYDYAALENLLFKLDMDKAYDRADWDFMEYMLHRTSFGECWRRWILECFCSPFCSMLVNGWLTHHQSLLPTMSCFIHHIRFW